MRIFNYVIKAELGIHARPAGLLVKEANKFQCEIKLSTISKTVDAKEIMGILQLVAKQGDEIMVTADGVDENAAIESMGEFFKNNL